MPIVEPTRTYQEQLYAKALDNNDYIYFKLYEDDPWPDPDDIVVSWKSKQVSQLSMGSNQVSQLSRGTLTVR